MPLHSPFLTGYHVVVEKDEVYKGKLKRHNEEKPIQLWAELHNGASGEKTASTFPKWQWIICTAGV